MVKRGVILSGGLGTRLRPATDIINKHLIPLIDGDEAKPMIYYPIETLVKLGITNICIVVGGNSVGDIINLLGDGSKFGADFTYKYQRIGPMTPMGIAQALSLTEDFAQGEDVAVILGDNLFLDKDLKLGEPPCIYITESEHPERFGCVLFETGLVRGPPWMVEAITAIEEKPKEPSSNYIVTGLYLYPNNVYDYIRTLEPSGRGELEISDVNNWYIKQGKLNWIEVKHWCDCGEPASLFEASAMIKAMREDELR